MFKIVFSIFLPSHTSSNSLENNLDLNVQLRKCRIKQFHKIQVSYSLYKLTKIVIAINCGTSVSSRPNFVAFNSSCL